MLQPESSSALPIRFPEIAERWELSVGRDPSLEQVQQRRDRSGSEPQEHQGMQERHVSSRNAMPNGMSERTWWYAMPWPRHALRHVTISRSTVAA